MTDPAGPIASDIAQLWWLLLALGVAVYFVSMALLLGPITLRRKDVGPTEADEVRTSVGPRLANRWIVGGGVVMPTVVLVIVLGVSVSTMQGIPQTAGSGDLVIEVIGRQWWWSVNYPDEQFTVANEIHIPVGERVELRLTSTDVIHSFWVPELHGKLDALPDGTNTLVVQADKPGEYRGNCAEFCGLQHAKMGMLVIAEPPEQFQAWVASHQRPSAVPSSPETIRGEQVFVAENCGSCHTITGTEAIGQLGPDLTHFASQRTLASVTLANTSEELARWIRDPGAIKEGVSMPGSGLNDDELAALVDYLLSLE